MAGRIAGRMSGMPRSHSQTYHGLASPAGVDRPANSTESRVDGSRGLYQPSTGHNRVVAFAAAMTFLVSGCGSASVTPTPTPTPAPTPSAGLFVDAGSDQGLISPLVYGTNTGPWLPVPFDLQSTIVAAGLTTITFPGGNWGDENDVTEDQVDQFIAFCRQLNAAPRIVVRLKGGTAAQAADLVKYANVTKKYGVKYWGIGNEPDLYVANGLTGYNVDRYNKDWREWAKAMLAVDSTIKLVGPDVSQFVANPSADYLRARTDWLSSFLKANGDLVDIVSIHRYPFPLDPQVPPAIDDLRSSSKEWDDIIPALRAVVRAQTGHDLPVAVTEVNSSWAMNSGGAATMDSHYNAIWFADVLGRLMEQKVTMVDQFALAGDWGIVGSSAPKPMYYDFMMYRRFGTRLVRAASDDPLVRVYAATRVDGTLTVVIVNLGDASATKPLTIVGGTPATSAETWVFDQVHAAEKIAATPLSAGGTVTVSAQSVTLLVVEQ